MRKVSKETRDKNRERERQRRSTLQGRAYQLLFNYRRFDREKGWVNDLTIEFLLEHILSRPCIYCGDPKTGADRRLNSKPHNCDNILPSCGLCNRIRGNFFSVEEMLLLGQRVREIKLARVNHENPERKSKYQPRAGRPGVLDSTVPPGKPKARPPRKDRRARDRESRTPKTTRRPGAKPRSKR